MHTPHTTRAAKQRTKAAAAAAVALALTALHTNAQDAPPQPPAETQAPTPTQAQAPTVRFAFKDQSIDQIIDFLARATGIPVIRETDVPQGKVTFISDRDYPLTDALRVLNTVLRTRGVVVRQDAEFLYFGALNASPQTPVPTTTDGQLPEGVTGDQIVTVVIPLNNATADAIVKAIQPLAAPYGSIVALQEQNAVILTETADQVRRLRSIATALDAEPGFKESVRVFELEHVNAQEIVAEVLRLLSESENKVLVKQGGAQVVEEITSVKGVRVIADPRLNALVAVGVESRLRVVEQIVALLDSPSATRRGDYAAFQLSAVDPGEAARIANQLFNQTPRQERPTILPLPLQGKLIVTGTAAAIGKVEALIQEIDPAADAPGTPSATIYRVIDAAPGSANALASTLRQLLPPADAAALRISPIQTQDIVLIAGPRTTVDRVSDIAATVNEPLAAQRTARILAIDEQTTRDNIDDALNVLKVTDPEAAASVTVTYETSTAGRERALIVGPDNALTDLTRILADLRAADTPIVETRSFALDRVTPSATTSRIAALLRALRPQLTPGAPTPTFTPFDEAGELIVTAAAEDFDLIERLVQIVREPEPRALQLRVIPLNADNPEQLAQRAAETAETLSTNLPETERGSVSYEYDALSGNLILTGDDRGIAAFENALNQLRRLSPPARTARLYTVNQADAKSVLAALDTMLEAVAPQAPGRNVPDPTFTVIEGTNTIVATAEDLQHRVIADAIRRLDVNEPSTLPPLKLFQVRAADATQIARMLSDQYNRRSAEQRRDFPADIRSDAATNTLVVAAHPDLLPDIQAFVDDLNAASTDDAERVTEIFPLKVAKAEDLARAMERLYPEPPMPRDRRGNPQPWLQEPQEVTVSADPASNSLIVDAPAERIPAFTALVEKLDRVELPPQAELRTYPVPRADLGAVARTLQSLANQGSLSAPSTSGSPRVPITIETEERSRTLIVAGDDVTHALVERILQELGSVPIERQLRVVRVENADPQAVADQALEVYAQQTADMPNLGTVDVNVDNASNALLVVAPLEAMNRFLAIIDQLEQQAGPARELRLVELQHAKAADVAAFLADLIESSSPFVQGPFTDPVFDPIERNNTLLIAAQPDQFPVIDSLIRSLDQPEGATAGPLRILRLRTADALNLASVLNTAYAQRPAEERGLRPVSVRADANTNTLVVSAHPEMLPEIQAIVDQLNESQTFDSEDREIRIFPLQVARAEELARTLDQMFPAPPVPLDRRGNPIFGAQEAKEVQVRADPQTNSIIVDAPGRRLAGFEQLVEQLDRAEMRAQTELRTYRITDADINALKRSIDRIASAGGIATPQSGAAIVVEVEPDTSTLVVSAPTDAFAQIETLINAVDEAATAPTTRLGFYALSSTRADRIAPIVERLLSARVLEYARANNLDPDDLRAAVTVAPEPQANAIVVNAPAPLVDLAAEVIAQLDAGTSATGQTQVRVITLAHADPAQTARAITQAAQARQTTSPDLSVIPAESSSAVIVTGTEADIDFIAALADQLDTPTITDGQTVKTIYLEHNSAAAVARVIDELFASADLPWWERAEIFRRTGQPGFDPTVTVAADESLNAIVITAPADLVAVIEQTIRELDRPTTPTSARTTRIVPLANADAAQTAQTLQDIFAEEAGPTARPPLIRADAAGNALIVVGSDPQLARLQTLAESLDNAAIAARDIRTIPLDPSRANAAQIAQTLQRLLGSGDASTVEVISIEELLERQAQPAPESPTKANPTTEPQSRVPGTILVPQPVRLIINFRQAPYAAVAIADEPQDPKTNPETSPEPTPDTTTQADTTTINGPTLNDQDRVVLQDPKAAADQALADVLAEARRIFAEQSETQQQPTADPASETNDQQDAPSDPHPAQSTAAAETNPADITIAADPDTNTLVVLGSRFAVDRITQLARQLEAQLPAAATRIRILKLQDTADARSVANLLNATLRQLGQRNQNNPAGLTGRVAVIPDTTTNALVIAANDADFNAITPIITATAAPASAAAQTVKVIDLENITARAAAAAVRDMLSGAPVGRQANRFRESRPIQIAIEGDAQTPTTIDTTSLRVSPAPADTALIVAGETPAVDFVTDFIALIDQSEPQAADAIRVYQLQQADAESIRRALQSVFDGSRASRGGGSVARAIFQADRQSNTLIVTATAQQHDEVTRLLTQLDTQDPETDTQTEFFTLQSAQPSRVARTLNELVIGADAARRARMTISADDPSGLLIVKGTQEELAEARALIAQLDTAGEADFPVRSIKLERADAEDVARSIQRFFDDRARVASRPGQRPQRRISVVGESNSSTLLISASDDDFELIEQLVANFDAEGGAQALTFEIIQLENARARDVFRSIEDIGWSLTFGPRQRELLIVPDERLNAIVVLGAGEEFLQTIRSLVAQLDKPTADQDTPVIVRAFKVENGDVAAIQRAVQRATARPGQQTNWWEPEDATAVRFETDFRSSTILAIGTEAQLAEVEAIIAELESKLTEDAQELAVVELAFADAGVIADAINRFFALRAQQAGARTTAVSAVGQRGTPTIILTGPADQLAIATDLAARLDTPDTDPDERTVEILPLESANPADIVRTLRDLYPRQRSTGRFPVVATPDARTQSVIVSAPKDLFDEVRQLVANLDQPTGGDDLILETFRLTDARAQDVKLTIEQTLGLTNPPRRGGAQNEVQRILDEQGNPVEVIARITANERSNAVIVTADEPSMRLIAKLVTELDTQDAAPPTEVRIFKLERALATDLSFRIGSLMRSRARAANEPIPAIESDRAANTLIVSATKDQLEEIARLIQQFDVNATTRQTEFLALEFADATQVSRALGNFFGPFAPAAETPGARMVSITADPASNSLVVSAPEDQWDRIRALVADLDDERYDPSRQLEVIPLIYADATSVARAVQAAFDAPLAAEFQRERERQAERERQRNNQSQGNIPFLFSAPAQLVDPDEVVSVSAEPITNALIVSASNRDLERIRAIVKQLDVASFAALPTPQIIRIDEGRPSDIQAAIERLYTNGDRNRSARGLRIVADNDARVLIVRGSDEEVEEIRQLASQLTGLAAEDGPTINTIALTSQAAARLIPVITSAFNPIAQQQGVPLTITADARSNTLIVTTTPELFDDIRALARELDGQSNPDAPAPDPQTESADDVTIAPVTNRSAAQIRQVLIDLGVTRPQPADRLSIVAEPVTLALIPQSQSIAISGNPRDVAAVLDLIKALDTATDSPGQNIRVIPLKSAQASQLVPVIERLLNASQTDSTNPLARALAEQTRRLNLRSTTVSTPDAAFDLTQPIRLDPAPDANAIVVTASQDNIQAVAELISLLDTLPIGDAVTVRIFHLSNNSAEAVSRIVRQLFAQGEAIRRNPGTNIRGIPTTETGQALAGDVAISTDERTNAVIVAGREQAVALVEVLIEQIDRSQPATWVETRLIPLVHADARRLAETINRVIVQGVADTATELGLQRQVGRLRIAGDTPTSTDTNSTPNFEGAPQLFAPLTKLIVEPEQQLNALILVGAAANLDLIERFAALLDVEKASRDALIRVYPLTHASADRVRGLLLGLFREQVNFENLRPEDQVSITADTRTNALIIATSTRSFALIEQLLRTLDTAEINPTVTVELVPVGNADAASLAPKIERIMRDRLRANTAGVPSARDIVTIVPDEASNALIVTASEENLALIRDLVERLSQDATPRGGAFEIFPLRSADAEDLADLLNEIYVEQANDTRGDRAITVEPDERLNAIVATGTPQDIEEIRRLIQQLDTTTVGSVTEIRNIALRSANALEMVNLINGIIAGNRRGNTTGRQATVLRFARGLVGGEEGAESVTEAEVSAAIRAQVSLEPDLRTNSVLVSAPPTMMVLIESLIDELDTLADGARTIRIFKLVNADAEAMAEVLRELFNLRRQGGVFVLVPSAVDPAADPSAGDDLSFSTVPDERRQLSITIDPRTNSLLVSGSQEYLDRVEEVVTNLDSEAGLEREQLTIELKNARTDEVADALQEFIRLEQDRIARTLGPDASGSIIRRLEREISVVGVPGSSRLILSASPRYMDTVRALIAELDAPPKQVLIQVLLAEVTLDTDDTFGVELEVGPFGGDRYEAATRAGGGGFGGPFGGAALTALGVPNLSVASIDFNLLIRALEVQGRLEVLSRPQILVNDNETARIQVGQTIQLVTNVNRLDDGRVTSDVTPEELGVILTVTPSISDDNFVRLDLNPTISALTTQTTQVSEDFSAPVISVRTAETTVTVKDNETIIIGGLIQNRSETRKFKVPLLGDIPLVGLIFNSEQDTTEKTELLIILTPRVISNQEDANRYTDIEIDRLSLPEPVKDALRANDINIDQTLNQEQEQQSTTPERETADPSGTP